MVPSCGYRGKLPALAHVDKGNIKRTSAEIIHKNIGVFPPVIQAIGHGRRVWFINDLPDRQARGLGCIQCRLPFTGIEIRGDRDDRIRNRISEGSLRFLLQVAEKQPGKLFRCVGFPIDIAIRLIATHLAFERGYAVRLT